MEKEEQNNIQNNSNDNSAGGGRIDRSGLDGGVLRASLSLSTDLTTMTTKPFTGTASSSFDLQWGSRKRLRCMKVQHQQVKDKHNASSSVVHQRTATVHVDHFNLRQRPTLPQPPLHRVLRNTRTTVMRGQSNGSVRRLASPDKKTCNENHNVNNNNKAGLSSDKGGSSSGSGEAVAPVVWPPKLLLALSNKEKEEDFYAFKGSAKLPQRPKKRAKFIQRTLNLVSPGQWLCDLTLERYEVREKKTSKKRPRGLKAMSNMDSNSDSD